MRHWKTALQGFTKKSVLVFLTLGFSCGIPFNLLVYSFSLWATEAGISLKTIGAFSLLLLPYSLKFLWAPFIDRIHIPVFSSLIGAKKTWGLLFQLGLIICIIGLAFNGPENQQISTVGIIFAFGVSFFAASQDIVVDALRIDTVKKRQLGEAAGNYQIGYRIGMLLSGAGVVFMASVLSWKIAYLLAGLLIFTGFFALFSVKEPPFQSSKQNFFKEMVVLPFKDFMHKESWILILIFIVLYKCCNTVLGKMAGPFYIQNGFSKEQIALVSGIYGSWITLIGVPVGGVLTARFGILKTLFGLGIVEIITSLAFALLALCGASIPVFILVITFDNIVGGMGAATFVAFLSALCSKKYSATQYALLTSLTAVATSLVAANSGILATKLGWPLFFAFTGLLMLPALFLLNRLIIATKK